MRLQIWRVSLLVSTSLSWYAYSHGLSNLSDLIQSSEHTSLMISGLVPALNWKRTMWVIGITRSCYRGIGWISKAPGRVESISCLKQRKSGVNKADVTWTVLSCVSLRFCASTTLIVPQKIQLGYILTIVKKARSQHRRQGSWFMVYFRPRFESCVSRTRLSWMDSFTVLAWRDVSDLLSHSWWYNSP